MFYLFAQASPPSVTIDATTIAVIIGAVTLVLGGLKALEKWIDTKLDARKLKNGTPSNGTQACAGAGTLPLSEKTLAKAVDELHEVTLMGQPVSVVQRQRREGHEAILNTAAATQIVARELVRKRVTEENGKKDPPEPGPDDTAQWDLVLKDMIKKERT